MKQRGKPMLWEWDPNAYTSYTDVSYDYADVEEVVINGVTEYQLIIIPAIIPPIRLPKPPIPKLPPAFGKKRRGRKKKVVSNVG